MNKVNVVVEFKDVVKEYGEGEGKQIAVNHVDFTIDEGEFVEEDMPVGCVHQLDFMVHAVVSIFIIRKHEIENPHGIDPFELEIPVTPLSLFTDGESGIKHTTILEIVLLRLLHFYNESFAGNVFAVHVENGLAVQHAATQLLAVAIGDVTYLLMPLEERVEETDEQFLVHFSAEKLLEAKVGIWVDVFSFHLVVTILHANIAIIID